MGYVCEECGEPITKGIVAKTIVDGGLAYLHFRGESDECYMRYLSKSTRTLSPELIQISELEEDIKEK